MRKNYLACGAVVLLLSGAPSVMRAAERGHDWDSQYTVKEQQTVRNSFPVTAVGKHRLVVDNIFGSVDIVGTRGNQVQMVVTQTFAGETQQKLELAKKEVSLDTSNDDGVVRLYVNGPFRCDCHRGWGSDDHKGYMVKMDFKLEVPADMELEVSTVNDGDITVKDVGGEFRVHNVNGSIDMTDVASSGVAKTVNGHVKVSFRENPKQNSEFSSINGEVALTFAQNLSADFRFKNFNGGIYTDYELTQLPPQAATEQRKNGHFVYRADSFTGGRVGAGGPEIKVENLNGAIRILQRHV